MIGGAPITDEYATSIGADGYAPDAGSAVDAAMALLVLTSPRANSALAVNCQDSLDELAAARSGNDTINVP